MRRTDQWRATAPRVPLASALSLASVAVVKAAARVPLEHVQAAACVAVSGGAALAGEVSASA
ncbi:MAG: hypothetical protein ACYCVY_05340 [Acidiferrobacteraceae bacterium]